VITSINPPTTGVLKLARLSSTKIIVIGDVKSPENYSGMNCVFYSVEDQSKMSYRIAKKLPRNHYSRKMLGYLVAANAGAKVIFDTDDDNIPYDDFDLDPDFSRRSMPASEKDLGFINIYRKFSQEEIWPRGLPLRYWSKINESIDIRSEEVIPGVIQGLADQHPDVDAIHRLLHASTTNFNRRDDIGLLSGTWSPFNSQSTFFRREIFPLLYLPTTVSFRYTDILRSYVATPILWKLGYNVVFTKPFVYQERNIHDLMTDFAEEVPMYLTADIACSIAEKATTQGSDIYDMIFQVYSELANANIVDHSELSLLSDWLSDITECSL
jgi:hypothetical protein